MPALGTGTLLSLFVKLSSAWCCPSVSMAAHALALQWSPVPTNEIPPSINLKGLLSLAVAMSVLAQWLRLLPHSRPEEST